MKKPKAKGPKVKLSYADCAVYSSLPVKCPLCGVTVTPNVTHRCSKLEKTKS